MSSVPRTQPAPTTIGGDAVGSDATKDPPSDDVGDGSDEVDEVARERTDGLPASIWHDVCVL